MIFVKTKNNWKSLFNYVRLKFDNGGNNDRN